MLDHPAKKDQCNLAASQYQNEGYFLKTMANAMDDSRSACFGFGGSLWKEPGFKYNWCIEWMQLYAVLRLHHQFFRIKNAFDTPTTYTIYKQPMDDVTFIREMDLQQATAAAAAR